MLVVSLSSYPSVCVCLPALSARCNINIFGFSHSSVQDTFTSCFALSPHTFLCCSDSTDNEFLLTLPIVFSQAAVMLRVHAWTTDRNSYLKRLTVLWENALCMVETRPKSLYCHYNVSPCEIQSEVNPQNLWWWSPVVSVQQHGNNGAFVGANWTLCDSENTCWWDPDIYIKCVLVSGSIRITPMNCTVI